MKISSISGVVYRVRDLDRTTEFYETLGFRMGKRDERTATCYVNWFWVTFLADDGADGGNGDGGAGAEPGPTLYLKVDDLDDFYGAVLAHGFSPSTEPGKGPTGRREFLLLDPDGNRLAFFTK
ncbi:VOC family protein [Streptomyces sp. MAR4 CNX-425]|uniref:VOC family protein n=1 Tax=Streptomyces sp. MAR4 CNX-425 TaxID=3406343 RepID=UPI003B50D2D5